MPAPRKYKLILTGHFAGQDLKIRNYQFVKGVLELYGVPDQVEGVINYMGKTYRAYLEGSDELKAAQKGAADGPSEVDREDPETGEPVDSGVRPDGEGSPEVSAVLDEGSDDSAPGTGGSDPAGSGHADAGVSPASEGGSADNPMNGDMAALRAAVLGLDPDVDENWTALGKPAMGALEYLGGGVTRKMVVAAAGDFDRDKARELKSL
jgi:hypothetical protein